MSKVLLLIVIICLTSLEIVAQSSNTLFLIREKGKWGYIDGKGNVVIAPEYLAAGNFSEGLAPVRKTGFYGYVDERGNEVISARFDFAQGFYEGIAKVYLENKPYYIDKEGNILFEHDYQSLERVDKYLIQAKDSLNLYSLVDLQGHIIAEDFQEILYSSGSAVVKGLFHEPDEGYYEVGVIDRKGNFVIPYGKYAHISPITNGIAAVKYPGQENTYRADALVDTLGNVLFEIPDEKIWTFESRPENSFSEGLATVEIPLIDRDTIKSWSSNIRYDFRGIINLKGELVASDTAWEKITSFRQKRAFVKDTSDLWYMMDTKGKIINEMPFEEILYDHYQDQYFFSEGIAIVETLDGWTAVDTSGQILSEPLALDISEIKRHGNLLLYSERNERNKYQLKHGFWAPKAGLIVPADYDYLAPLQGDASILVAKKRDKTMYLDAKGKVIWRQNKPVFKRKEPYNIDYMNRGYFYAGSPHVKELAGFGGWGSSKNLFVDMSSKLDPRAGILQILVENKGNASFQGDFEGINVYVVNAMKDTVLFPAQDSRLYMKVQAQDSNGQWSDIEYLPSSWCGNSYHTLYLPPDSQWNFVMPKYQGEIETFLRLSLRYKGQENEKKQIIFSQPFRASVNPGQFWRKREYTPSGIMDPYND